MEATGKRAYEQIIILDEHAGDREKANAAIIGLFPEARVVTAASTLEFREHIDKGSFDMIVLDHHLSDYDGISLIHELRRLKEWDPAILVIAEARNPQDVAEVYNSGCHRCVVKQGDWTAEIGDAVRGIRNMKRFEDERKRLVAKLTEANAMLAEKNKRLDEFSGTVAHDIRGPLGTISMKLEYIKDIYGDDFDERFKGIVNGTLESTRRLIDVVQAMYEYAKLSSKAQKTEEIHLETFVEEVIADLNFDDNLDIQIGIGVLPSVWGNPGLLRKVFQNLISNAVKYSDKRTTIINISCDGAFEKSLGRYAVIRVSDNGPGIPFEDQKDIFTMFRRGSTTSDQEGIGVGLSVVKRIIELHFGSIEVESEPAKGASFLFSLPVEPVSLEA